MCFCQIVKVWLSNFLWNSDYRKLIKNKFENRFSLFPCMIIKKSTTKCRTKHCIVNTNQSDKYLKLFWTKIANELFRNM